MSLFLSKLLPRLVYPLGLTTGLLLLAFFLVWWGRKRLAAAFLLLAQIKGSANLITNYYPILQTVTG